MKTKYLFTIATLFGLSLVPALPSHSQPNNPCKLAPFAPPSRETRQIRVEKYGIAFNIPANYRTRSNITDNNMRINVYSPSGFDYYECLVRNKVSTDEHPVIALVSIDKVNTSTSLTELIDSSYNRVRVGRVAKIIRNLTFANQPAVILQYRDALYEEWIGLIFLSSSKKYLVDISYGIGSLSKETQNSAEKVAETIKSSFTFDTSSSADSKAVNSDDLISVVQTKACQLLNQGSSISDVLSNVKPTVKKLDQEYLFIHANLSRKMHSESGNDVDIVTRRMIGGAIKRDCPQFQNKLTDYYKRNLSSFNWLHLLTHMSE